MTSRQARLYFLLKTMSYQCISLIKMVLFSWVILGEFEEGALAGICLWAISFIVYWTHEQVYYKIWKRIKNKDKRNV